MDFEMLPSLVEQDAQLCFVLKERAQNCTALGPDSGTTEGSERGL